MPKTLSDAVRIVAILNAAYFGIEFAVALRIGSVSLFADSIDFLEDAAVNFLILFALAWSAPADGVDRHRIPHLCPGRRLVAHL
jgi:Co/Zn/Cd efflux system component